MSIFAVIPWGADFYSDGIFDVNNPLNRDYLLEPFFELKLEFERRGHVIHTVDLFDTVDDIDFFLFFIYDGDWIKRIRRLGKADKMVYCNSEPPSVYKYNSQNGFRVLRHIFPYILTWNDDWIDGKSIFKRNTPYWFVDQRDGNRSFTDKKLITCISGNKTSNYPGELYSERERAIDYFETCHPDDFDLYGTGWDKTSHKCYRGRINNKAQTYHGYRFAICFENIERLKGYITEKLLDCLVSGIVPVYAGSSDIEDYVPRDCFVSLRDFEDYDSLYEYLSCMEEPEYTGYLNNANDFLNSPKSDYFSGKRYAEYILEAVSHEKSGFRSSVVAYKVFKYFFY